MGNLINIVKVITLAGVSDGGIDKIVLKQENENDANIMPKIIITKFIEFQNEKIEMHNINGTIEITEPNMKDAQTSPNNIVFIEIGQVINLSSVFCLVSQGKTTGPIDVADKKRTIAINPETI